MDTTYGACCRKFKEKYCRDCTKGTPCCGHNKCNIFCCGCRCRREPSGKDCVVNQGACECYKEKGKRSVPFPTTDMSAYVTFMDLDINKNGMMDQVEFTSALEQMQITDNVTVFHHWSIMDEDKDGIISLEEFDREKL
ncbi:uncharacterized protein LOC134706173 [Mytilus trossulus]|uniref:uncharacterized protein LOC134706173 n=1 Tax=Mytilus trossulus TaxID=6551 RepID=UPI003004EFFB